MASIREISCPSCGVTYKRAVKQINVVIKRSGLWRCKSCVLTDRNKSNAKPIGSVRTHKQTGYLEEKTDQGWVRQHILVMERHLGRRLRRGEVVHHVNEVKTDNRIENLELMLNSDHTALHHIGAKRGTRQRERIRDAVRAKAKLTTEKAHEIRRLAESGQYTQRSIAQDFGVSPMTISRVVNMETWS